MMNITNDMEEEWRDVIGYEGLYQVSNFGRVKSLPKLKKTPTTTFWTKEKIKASCLCKGYFRVSLMGKSHFVHILVAEAFIGKRNGMTVNHIDECKTNNHLSNLEYMSLSDNIRYGTGVKRSAERRKDNPLICTPVNQYTLDGLFVKKYISINRAISENGFESNNISMCCCHKRNQSNGYIWRYDGDNDVSYNRKTNAKKIVQLGTSGEIIAEFSSLREASKVTGVSSSKICCCCKGKINQTKGLKFKYKEDNE